MKHTPGPWKFLFDTKVIDENELKYWRIYSAENMLLIGEVYDSPIQAGNANTKLIAAAPDLLEACKDMIEAFKKSSGVPTSLNDAYWNMKQIIKKAQGK